MRQHVDGEILRRGRWRHLGRVHLGLLLWVDLDVAAVAVWRVFPSAVAPSREGLN